MLSPSSPSEDIGILKILPVSGIQKRLGVTFILLNYQTYTNQKNQNQKGLGVSKIICLLFIHSFSSCSYLLIKKAIIPQPWD